MKIQKPCLFILFCFTAQIILIGCNGRQSTNDSPVTNDSSDTQGGAGQVNKTGVSTPDFVIAARAVMPAVVHIKVRLQSGVGGQYGAPATRDVVASGSGVIVSKDGYIATNNHVIENAIEIKVVLPDKRIFAAKLIGRDPNTDLALLKVDADNLPVVGFGNSDSVEVGEWVLAIGFPLSLNTTVTAGIVSAKARSIGIIGRGRSANPMAALEQNTGTPVESFIQTDAAINQGNSGGALVNTSGALIGINSAIASQTGSYAGYAFAIPVNLAEKILDDLKQYGEVRRGVLGVSFPSPADEAQVLAQKGLDPSTVGVFISNVQPNSAADSAGLKPGDIIQSLEGVLLKSSTEFSERIARLKPGDVIKLTYSRQGKSKSIELALRNEKVQNSQAKTGTALQDIYNRLGATFSPLPTRIKEHFSLDAGVLVSAVLEGGFFDQVGIPPGTIIAFINGQAVTSPADIDRALLSSQTGTIQIFAIAPDGSKVVFNFSLGT